jgi:large subunit ribosomal protein L21
MAKCAIIKTGGKQYLVKENEEIFVERLSGKENEKLDIETLAVFDDEQEGFDLGGPAIKAEIAQHLKGEKVRIAKFKAKVRFRKVRGFRPQLTKIKILSI